MDSLCSSLFIGILSGIISSIITGFWLLRYSEFIDCKKSLQQQLGMTHLYVFQLGQANHHEKLMELQSTVLIVTEKLYETGHEKSVRCLGNMTSEVILLDNLIASSAISALQISDYFKKWIKDVNNLPVSWLALLNPCLKRKTEEIVAKDTSFKS